MTLFQEGEDDEDIPDHVSNHGPAEPSQPPNTPVHGPISWSHANKQQQEVNSLSLLTKIDNNINGNVILRKCLAYVLLSILVRGEFFVSIYCFFVMTCFIIINTLIMTNCIYIYLNKKSGQT
jgi:hypothetical protein